jgi:hypothetical protein
MDTFRETIFQVVESQVHRQPQATTGAGMPVPQARVFARHEVASAKPFH